MGISYPVPARYKFSRALFRTLDAENRARALESRVDSPGSVGKKPDSVTFSSSASSGYSTLISSSRRRTGRPVAAAANL